MNSGPLTWDLFLDLPTLDRGCKWVGGGGNVHICFNVRDFEGAFGKRSWSLGEVLGLPGHFLGSLGMFEGGLGDSLGTV